ncbi:CopG family transcriptional regulator [Rhizobium laguerreae]|uniref:CopG family transcriptional regulator n=1 Tax=Rhizobium laguerreae TaxID=1076926 RepID=UPI001FF03F1B|nr:CopG family transcriptional regulator [Rhizobium laguerreae]
MRTTLAIDDDVLIAAKAMATQQHRSVGEVISELARRSLRRPPSSGERSGRHRQCGSSDPGQVRRRQSGH